MNAARKPIEIRTVSGDQVQMDLTILGCVLHKAKPCVIGHAHSLEGHPHRQVWLVFKLVAARHNSTAVLYTDGGAHAIHRAGDGHNGAGTVHGNLRVSRYGKGWWGGKVNLLPATIVYFVVNRLMVIDGDEKKGIGNVYRNQAGTRIQYRAVFAEIFYTYRLVCANGADFCCAGAALVGCRDPGIPNRRGCGAHIGLVS